MEPESGQSSGLRRLRFLKRARFLQPQQQSKQFNADDNDDDDDDDAEYKQARSRLFVHLINAANTGIHTHTHARAYSNPNTSGEHLFTLFSRLCALWLALWAYYSLSSMPYVKAACNGALMEPSKFDKVG